LDESCKKRSYAFIIFLQDIFLTLKRSFYSLFPKKPDLGFAFRCFNNNIKQEQILDLQHLSTDIQHRIRSNNTDSKSANYWSNNV